MARLVLNAGTPQARELVLKDGVNRVGRAETNDFHIPEASVSSSHCEIIKADGCVRLRDLGSTNGTFVNGARVTEIELKVSQPILLGAIQVMFERDGTPSPAKPVIRVTPVTTNPTPQVARAVPPIATPPPRATHLRVAGAAPPQPDTVPDGDVSIGEADPVSRFHAPPDAKCKYHPRTLARWICSGCGKTYCDLCVAERHSGATHQMFCRGCGAVAAPLEVHFEAPVERSFFRELPGAFVYPFRGAGPLIIVFGTILFAALEFLSFGIFGLLVKALAIGYLYSYLQTILHSTAAEDKDMPGMPGMDDLFSGCFRLVGTVLIAFGPAGILAYLAIGQQMPVAGIALIPAVIFGGLYLPMAFLAVAMKDNVAAANPLIVIPSIVRVPLEYLVTALLVAGIFGLRYLGDV
ncbi:MAG TPA: FHA domain-containing protein, partial [Verrucomicrobiae bacterium]|nr:FHA domain-containing protein [Verrucomicrobiae bacterium]